MVDERRLKNLQRNINIPLVHFFILYQQQLFKFKFQKIHVCEFMLSLSVKVFTLSILCTLWKCFVKNVVGFYENWKIVN